MTEMIRCLGMPLTAVIFLFLTASATEAEVFEVPPERGIQLGQGVNSVSVEPMGLCIAPGPVTDPGGGQTVEVEAKRFDSRDELEGFLKIEAQASLNTPFSASGKFQFLGDRYKLETATYFFVKVSVRNPTRTLTEHRWASPLPLELWQQGPEDFFAACGDQFVHGVTSGGELIVEVKISHVTEKERLFIVGHVDAGFGGIIESIADLQAKLRKLHEDTTFSYRLYRQGSIGPIEFDLDALTEQIRNFPLEVLENPWDMSFETLPYSVLLGAEALDLSEERLYIRDLGARRNHWSDLADRLDSVIENRWQFARRPGLWRLRRSVAKFRAHLAELDRTFFECDAELPAGCDLARFPGEPTSINVPRRILLDRMWVNGGLNPWCRASTSTHPLGLCNAQEVGFLVAAGPWAKTELFEAPQPATGKTVLWDEPKGPSVGWTMRWPRGRALFACGNGQVMGKRGAPCSPIGTAKELIGFAFSPRVAQ